VLGTASGKSIFPLKSLSGKALLGFLPKKRYF
jgi:hypothetical protein